MVINPELLRQLQTLLARLTEMLVAQQTRTTLATPPPVNQPLSRIVLDIGREPEILSITPPRGALGTTVTIRGRGFTATGNTVYASYGTFPDRPSLDGETITLKIEPPGLPPNLGSLKTANFPELRYRFYIRNTNGETKTPGEFVLDL